LSSRRRARNIRAVAYSSEPLLHRHLVIYEAAEMASEFATYLIRSLLSEGCVRYETVEKTQTGLEARLIEREGPTGLIVTTTNLRLHPENETRMLSLTITDTSDQTAAVFRAFADLVAEGVDATVKPEIREVVETTARLLARGLGEVRQTDLTKALKLDKSAISRRVAGALDGGFLKNLEDRKHRPARLVLGDPLPANRQVLPLPDQLISADGLHGCAVDRGDMAPSAPMAGLFRRTRG
jgi:hypothetical protein